MQLVSSATASDVTVVTSKRHAYYVLSKLMSLPPDRYIAWDTETTGVDPTKESPVGKGSVICATAYAGDDVNWGAGSRLFVDFLEGDPGLMDIFKPYFESERLKVWHNYSFDRHVFFNGGIDVRGFGGDTMHMARLVDSGRTRYSLHALSEDYLGENATKSTMEERFGRREVLKNGNLGKKTIIPETVELQTGLAREEWIDYATDDSLLTLQLCYTFRDKLENMDIKHVNSMPSLRQDFHNSWQLYESVIRPFGEMLTDVERTGFKVDIDWLRKAQRNAEIDEHALEDSFREWACTQSPDAKYMNIHSHVQKQQLFFAPFKRRNGRPQKKKSKESVQNWEKDIKELKDDFLLPPEKSFELELNGHLKKRYLEELKVTDKDSYDLYMKNPKKKVKKTVTLKGLNKTCSEITAGGLPSCSAAAMRKLAGRPRAQPPVYGEAEEPAACLAIDDLISATSISTLNSTFITPLQDWPSKDGRIHASLNLNTETGRISSRRPNLQNQPALEKDRYKIRKAFIAEPGKELIVADYGQLELRLLAHITKCSSMLEAFELGGDFHSRTACSMFDHVAAAVGRGDCILERHEHASADDSPPLLKDLFASERRKAKTLNFSIAYGKTVQGLAKDWNVDPDEAKETLNLWYKERQEVKKWQSDCKKFAHKYGYVETLLGRRRHLFNTNGETGKRGRLSYSQRAQAERAAINAPIQGSAADLVMAAMIKLHSNPILQALGWKIILQVHDEIILEGPEESSDLVMPVVIEVMKNPIDVPLRVELTVDARCASSWYDAK